MKFQPGHKFATGRPKGSKNKETLLKEERRAIFDEKISKKWDAIIDKLKPEYIADQFMGTAPQKLEAEVKEIPYDVIQKDNSIRENKKDIEED